ncbi:hypothetical protein HBDW_45140 [Herbaspirillum sp. DW155]|uniref:hypothetical protein n=1 Tax=Herbaspirillum sp. DW155 TaxID=3095609 RepID=UPI003092BAB1|nr:hypothetical protein HBDW_45140 [Herbaspirillum sp. DW155]
MKVVLTGCDADHENSAQFNQKRRPTPAKYPANSMIYGNSPGARKRFQDPLTFCQQNHRDQTTRLAFSHPMLQHSEDRQKVSRLTRPAQWSNRAGDGFLPCRYRSTPSCRNGRI